MESIESITQSLRNPWRARIRSLLADDDITATGFVWPDEFSSTAFATSIEPMKIQCELASFQPMEGPKLFDPMVCCEVAVPHGCTGFAANTWIGFHRAIVVKQSPLCLEIGEKSAIWSIANIERSLPISVGHLCAGAFGGWDRAFRWLVNEHQICCPMTFAVESDFTTLQTWCKANQASILQGPISPQVPQNAGAVGLLTPIQDSTWFNACRQQANLIFTASPPCQTWSNGGKQFGLEAENGLTFIQVIYGVKWVRPIACLVECSDTVPSHVHYPIIQKVFRFIGYKQCWSQIVPLHDFTGMKRSRWLSLFVRCDVQEFDVVGTFRLVDVHHKKWCDPIYDFFLPPDVVDQLQLSKELKHVYGDPQFLSGAKKGQVFSSECDVLRSRCISSQEHLPTLCASCLST